jgi:hypothetical protein
VDASKTRLLPAACWARLNRLETYVYDGESICTASYAQLACNLSKIHICVKYLQHVCRYIQILMIYIFVNVLWLTMSWTLLPRVCFCTN